MKNRCRQRITATLNYDWAGNNRTLFTFIFICLRDFRKFSFGAQIILITSAESSKLRSAFLKVNERNTRLVNCDFNFVLRLKQRVTYLQE